jgi:ligand-binding sensor domain-containing protein
MKKPLFSVGFGLALTFLFYQVVDAQWVNTNANIGGRVNALIVRDGDIFAGTDSGVFISSDNETNWTAFNNGLPKQIVNSIIVSDSGDIIAGTNDSGVFTHLKTGTSWTANNTGLIDLRITSLAVNGTGLLAGTGQGGGIYFFDDNDTFWTKADILITGNLTTVSSFAVCGDKIFAGSLDYGLFVSTNNGSSWNMSGGIITSELLRCMAAIGNNVFVGTPDGVYSSTDCGSNWKKVNNGLQHSDIRSLLIVDNYLFAGTTGGVYRSTEDGANWVAFNTGLMDTIYSLTASQNHIFAGTRSGDVWRRAISETSAESSHLKPLVASWGRLNLEIQYLGNKKLDITLSLPHPDHVDIALFNLYGQKITTLVNASLSSGFHTSIWNSRNISPGFYTMRVQTGTDMIIKNILISR